MDALARPTADHYAGVMIPKRIIVIGGSTVHGQGDPNSGGFVAHLRRWHETSSAENNRVFNLGVGADGVFEMLTRGPGECRARRPDLIILYPGLNDTRRVGGPETPPQHSFESVRKTLGTLISELGQISPLVVLSAVPVDESRTSPFWGKWYFRMSDAATMAKVVAEVCRVTDTPHMPLVETWASRADLKDLLADGVHLNSAGHELLFQELTSFPSRLFTADRSL